MTFKEVLRCNHVQFHVSGPEVSVCCPFCIGRGETQDTRFRLFINTVSGAAYCFNCGWKGRQAFSFILHQLLHGFQDGVDSEIATEIRMPDRPPPWPRDFVLLRTLWDSTDDLDQQAIAYVCDRGLTRAQIITGRVGVSYRGRYAYRILFPILEANYCHGFTARDFTGVREPKYLHSPGARYLFNYRTPTSCVVLAEGVFKALRLEQALARSGFSCLATLGHSLTNSQCEQLIRGECRQVILWPDPDRVGLLGYLHVADVLQGELGLEVKLVLAPQPADEARLPDMRQAFLRWTVPFTFRISQQIQQLAGRITDSKIISPEALDYYIIGKGR